MSQYNTSASAARYFFESGGNNNYATAQLIEKAEDELFLYGLVTAGQDTSDYYTLDVTEFTSQFTIELMMSDSTDKSAFRPTMVVADAHSPKMIGRIPDGFPTNVGGRAYDWPPGDLKYTKTEEIFTVVAAGPLYVKDVDKGKMLVAVYDPQGKGGRYVLKIGTETNTQTWTDYILAAIAYIRIKLLLY